MKKLQTYFYFVLVIGIFIFAAWTRLWGLGVSPPSVDFDEAALGYNAYSLLKTAKDEYGNFLPLSLRSFNDYKPALYSYLSIIPIGILGLNEVSTRLVSAASGIIQVVFIYLLLKEFFRGRLKLVLALMVVAAQPWLIHFSRTAFEANLGATFFLIGAWLLIRNASMKSVLFFALASYSYHSPRLAAPVLIALWAIDPIQQIVNWGKVRMKLSLLAPLLLFALLVIPIVVSSRDSLILKRYQQTNIFKVFAPFTPRELISNNNPWFSFPASPGYYLPGMILGRVVSYFSPIDLGGRVYHWVRNSPMYIPSYSMLGWVESLTITLGLVLVIRHLSEKKYRMLVYWVIAGVAPAAVTWEWFHPLRSLNVFPAILIISIVGLLWLGDRVSHILSSGPVIHYLGAISKVLLRRLPAFSPRSGIDLHSHALLGGAAKAPSESMMRTSLTISKLLVGGLFLVFFVPTIFYTVENELVYLVWSNHGEYQPGGYKEGVPILAALQDKYDKVIIDTPHAQKYIFFLFYQAYPPQMFQQYANIRPTPLTEGDLSFNFDKYEFRKINWLEDRKLRHVILWTDSTIKPEEVKREPGTTITEIKNAVGYTAAYIITID